MNEKRDPRDFRDLGSYYREKGRDVERAKVVDYLLDYAARNRMDEVRRVAFEIARGRHRLPGDE